MGLSPAVLLALAWGAALAAKHAKVTEACVEGDCSAAQPLRGQSILQVNSLDHSSAPVPADLVEEEEEAAEVKPRQAVKKNSRSGEKKRKGAKGKVLLQTAAATSQTKGAAVEEHRRPVSEAEVDAAMFYPPNPDDVIEEIIESKEAPEPITEEEEQEMLRLIKQAEDTGVLDKPQELTSYSEIPGVDKMATWAKFQDLGQLGDGQAAYEKTQEKGRTSEYLKARENFEKRRAKAAKKAEKAAKKAEKVEMRKAKANSLVQIHSIKKTKAQLLEDEERFSTDLHISAEEEEDIMARIAAAKANGDIQPPTKESLENIKEQVRHVSILQATPPVNAKVHNLALLQQASRQASANISGIEDASHGKSGKDMLDAIAAEAEKELSDEEEEAAEEAAKQEKLLPPENAPAQSLLQNSKDDMSKFVHMKETGKAKDVDVQRIATSMLQMEKILEVKAKETPMQEEAAVQRGPPGHRARKGPPGPPR